MVAYQINSVDSKLIPLLTSVFLSTGPFTVQLPSNEAFVRADPSRVEFLLNPENNDELRRLLLYHVIPGKITTSEFQAGPTETLLEGFPVDVTLEPSIMFDDGVVEISNVPACNGFVNILDSVLDPFVGRKYIQLLENGVDLFVDPTRLAHIF